MLKILKKTKIKGEIDMTRNHKLSEKYNPKEFEEKPSIPVQKYFIDTNQHVNNEKYVMLAQEFLPEDFKIREIRAEYKKAAVLNDILVPRVTKEKNSVTVLLGDANGKPYATILFLQ